jgi:hypothetical protein
MVEPDRHLGESRWLTAGGRSSDRTGRAFIPAVRRRTRCWREPDSNHRSRSCEGLFWALPIGDGGTIGGATYRFRSEPAMLAWSGCPQASLRGGTASSNPSSSSGESVANLTSSIRAPKISRRHQFAAAVTAPRRQPASDRRYLHPQRAPIRLTRRVRHRRPVRSPTRY